jgi:outer membrane protein assembly factor BamB
LRGRSVALLLLLAAATGGAAVATVLRSGSDVAGSASTEYVRSTASPRPAPADPWPQWGRVPGRTRTTVGGPRPPYRLLWAYRAGSLLEFPPTLARGRLFLSTFAGRLVALTPWSGRTLWRHDSTRCAWAEPAVAGGLVFQTFLLRPPRCLAADGGGGELAAFDARTGVVRWRAALPPTESSPLVAGGRVWVGDWSGGVSAFAARTGRRLWRFQADGAVKSSPALDRGTVYVASYGGSVYALSAATGRELWRARPTRLFRATRFYSTPALAHGRVYVGGLDGRVYALGAQTGALRWRTATGGYVYGSPAVWRDLVLVGSYDHRLYALDAATGARRWTFDAGGPISGSATVVGDVVYVSTLSERTFALDVRNGRLLWTFPDGKYCAGVADGRRFFLAGADRLFALVRR